LEGFMRPLMAALAAWFFFCIKIRDEMMPLAARRHMPFSDHAIAGGAYPASPAALPYPAGGTGVHTGFSTTQLIRG
jgi:hypothetical protein